MSGGSSGSGFNWQGAVSGLMKLAGAGISANRGILGPVFLQAADMMDRNQEFKRLRSMATESAISIRGTPEEEQIQNLIRNRQLENPEQIERLVSAGRGTQTAMALPRLLAGVTTQEQVPRAPVPLPREPAGSSVYPGGSFGAARGGVELPEPETVTRTRESTLQERLTRANQIDDPAARARAIAAVTGMRAGAADPDESARRTIQQEISRGTYDLNTLAGINALERRAAALGLPPEELDKYLGRATSKRQAAEFEHHQQLTTRHEADIEALSRREGFKDSFADELRSAIGDEKTYEARRKGVIGAIDRAKRYEEIRQRDAARATAISTEKDLTRKRQAATAEMHYITSRLGQLDRDFRLAEQYGDRQAMQQITDETIRLQGHAAQFEAILSGQAGVPTGAPEASGVIRYDESGNRVK